MSIPSILSGIIKKINVLMNMKNFSDCNSCPYNYIENKNYQKDNQYIHQNDYHENIQTSIDKLIKENEKYFIYEIERTTFDCIIYGTNHLKTMGYAHRIPYEIFEKYGIFMYVSDLVTYINSPRSVKYELQRLINIYGIEKVTEEIAIYLKNNYPQKFGISIMCEQ